MARRAGESKQRGGLAHSVPASDATAMPLWPRFLVGQEGRPVRVLLIEDDQDMRQIIRAELNSDARIMLAGEGGSVRDGRRLIDTHAFEVMLVDLRLTDGSGFELIEYMKKKRPLAEAVVVSVLDDDEHAVRAFELGATGYLQKSSWFGNFAQAILQVVNGGASITPGLARRLLKRIASPSIQPDRGEPEDMEFQALTARETEVLRTISAGYTSAEAGNRLGISEQTVNSHIKNIYRKLQVRTRAQAVCRATRWGLLE